MPSLILRVPSNFLRCAVVAIFNLICRIWQGWVLPDPSDPGKQGRLWNPPPPHFVLWKLNETHRCLPCLNVTKPGTDPQNSTSLPHKWSVELFVLADNQNKVLVKQILVNLLFLLQALNHGPQQPALAWSRVVGGEERASEFSGVSYSQDMNSIGSGPHSMTSFVLITSLRQIKPQWELQLYHMSFGWAGGKYSSQHTYSQNMK